MSNQTRSRNGAVFPCQHEGCGLSHLNSVHRVKTQFGYHPFEWPQEEMEETMSNQTKHTPGPWHVYEGGNFVKVGAEGYDEYVKEHSYLGGPFCVADVHRNATEDYSPNHDLAMANARLIAAAPELLEAARRVEEAWAGNGNMSTAVDACLLAIAKAEGRTP